MSKGGIAALSLFLYNRQNTLLRHSIFIIRYSTFAFLQFLLRSDWLLSKPAAGLNLEPLNPEPLNPEP